MGFNGLQNGDYNSCLNGFNYQIKGDFRGFCREIVELMEMQTVLYIGCLGN